MVEFHEYDPVSKTGTGIDAVANLYAEVCSSCQGEDVGDGPVVAGSADYDLLPAAVEGMAAHRGAGHYSAATQASIRAFLETAIDRDFFRRTFTLGLADSTPSFNQVCLEAECLLTSLGENTFPAEVRRRQAVETRRLALDSNTVLCVQILRPRTNDAAFPSYATGPAFMVTNNGDGTCTVTPWHCPGPFARLIASDLRRPEHRRGEPFNISIR